MKAYCPNCVKSTEHEAVRCSKCGAEGKTIQQRAQASRFLNALSEVRQQLRGIADDDQTEAERRIMAIVAEALDGR